QRVAAVVSAIERQIFNLDIIDSGIFVDDGDRLVIVSDQKIVKRSTRVGIDALKIEIHVRGIDGGRDMDEIAALALENGLVDLIVAAAGEVKLIGVVTPATEEIVRPGAADEPIVAAAGGQIREIVS